MHIPRPFSGILSFKRRECTYVKKSWLTNSNSIRTLILQPLLFFFEKKKGNPEKKARFFFHRGTPNIPWKRKEKRSKKSKENRKTNKKARKSKEETEGKSEGQGIHIRRKNPRGIRNVFISVEMVPQRHPPKGHPQILLEFYFNFPDPYTYHHHTCPARANPCALPDPLPWQPIPPSLRGWNSIPLITLTLRFGFFFSLFFLFVFRFSLPFGAFSLLFPRILGFPRREKP